MAKEYNFKKDELFYTVVGKEIEDARMARETALDDMLNAMSAFVKAWDHESDVIRGYFGYDREDLVNERKVGGEAFASPIEVIEWIVTMNK